MRLHPTAVRWLSLVVFLCVASAAYAQNSIQTENLKTGTTDWQLTNPAQDGEIEGYASLTSVNRGGQISLYVKSDDATYTIDIFRMGWYGLAGGRRVMNTITRSRVSQPSCPTNSNGMTECNWTSPYVLTVPGDSDPTNWASGVYLAKLTGTSSGKQSYIIFVVRDDARSSQYLFALDVTTYQAYNNWGGKSLYDYNSSGGRASKVSYNRPFAAGPQDGAEYGVGAGEFLTTYIPDGNSYAAGWEYNAVRWLEKEGYDVSYATVVDIHEQSDLFSNHAAYLSFGHNEYWSMEMWNNITAARDSGVNLGFFGANVAYWQIRFETSPVTGQANRTQVCYKSTSDPVNGPTETILFRDLGMPESELIGVYYETDPVDGDIVVQNTSHWVFEGTGLQDGDHLTGLLGYEVDVFDPDHSPPNTIILGESPYGGGENSHMTIYTADSGAFVFATGSMQWAWGLDDYNSTDLRPSFLSEAVEQATRNLLARFAGETPSPNFSISASPSSQSVLQGSGTSYTVTVTSSNGFSAAVAFSVSGLPAGAGGTFSPASVSGSGSSTLSVTTNGSTPTGSYTVTITGTSGTLVHTGTATLIVSAPGGGGFNPIRVNAGGSSVTDSQGRIWSADSGFSGGNAASVSAGTAIANTVDDALYQSERWGAFTYAFTVPAGSYQVTLKFAETYFTSGAASGQRLFNVAINGTTVLTNFDIKGTAGGANIAVDRTFAVNAGAGSNNLQIQFIHVAGQPDDPKVDSIEVLSAGPIGPTITTHPVSKTLTEGQTATFTVAASGSTPMSYQWRKGGAIISGAVSSSYTTPPTVAADNGATFDVVVSNAGGEVTSNTATLTVNPLAVVSVSLSPASVNGGASSTGTVTLNGPAPTGGAVVQLTSNNTSAATVGANVTVAANATTATFPVSTSAVGAVTQVSVTGTLNGSANATLTVNPPPSVTAVTLSPGAVTGGASSTGTVTLNGPAPAGGAVVQLTSSNTSTATVGANVTVAANATTATFTVNTQAVAASTPVTITATYNGTANGNLTVNPPPSFTPIRVNVGGGAFTDSQGRVWSADSGFSGGNTASVTGRAIANTVDDTLYQNERWGAFTYTFTVPAGSYQVTLKFAEVYFTSGAASGQRLFNVAINGTTALTNFDVKATAGGANIAVDRTFAVTAGAGNNNLQIQFIHVAGQPDDPKVDAIEIVAQ